MSAGRPALLERTMPAAILRWEGLAITVAACVFFACIPLALGGLGLGWDAINHHIYLGWTAQQQRFDRDFLAAGYQSLESPYVNWPLYRMAVAGWSGAAAGAVLALLQGLCVWPVWMVARAAVPGVTAFDFLLRTLSVWLAFLSPLVLSAFGSTLNDLLAAVPLVWAIALAAQPIARSSEMSTKAVRRYVAASGVCAGLSVAAKLSNGPLAVLMPGLWLLCGRTTHQRIASALVGSVSTLAGFAIGYGYWGWLLWRHFGNPVYPFYDHWFAPLRAWAGWAG